MTANHAPPPPECWAGGGGEGRGMGAAMQTDALSRAGQKRDTLYVVFWGINWTGSLYPVVLRAAMTRHSFKAQHLDVTSSLHHVIMCIDTHA